MATKIKRPTSVWVAQLVLFVFGLISIALLVVTVPTLFVHGPDASLPRLVLIVTANIAITAAFAAAIWGMFRRRAYGRWLGVAMLSLAFALTVIGQLFREQGPVESVASATGRQSSGALIAQILIAALFVLLIGLLAFSKRVAAFFTPANED